MRQISNKVFWHNVKNHVGEIRYSEIKEKFTVVQTTPQTPESLRTTAHNELIPIMMEAARINGCNNTESELAYQIEALGVYLEITKQFPRILADPQSVTEEENATLKSEKLYPRYLEISRRFIRGRLCHSSTDGFVCYCDEKTA